MSIDEAAGPIFIMNEHNDVEFDLAPMIIKFKDGSVIKEFDEKGNRNYSQTELKEIIKRESKYIDTFGFKDYTSNGYKDYNYIDRLGFFHFVTITPEKKLHTIGETNLIDTETKKTCPLVSELIIENEYAKRSTPLNPEFFFNKVYAARGTSKTMTITIGFITTINIDGVTPEKIKVFINFEMDDKGLFVVTHGYFGTKSDNQNSDSRYDVTFKTKSLEGKILKKYKNLCKKDGMVASHE